MFNPLKPFGIILFKRLLDALAGTKDPCFLGEQFCRHSVLLDPASSVRPCRAPRPDPPVVCPGFGLDRFIVYAFETSYLENYFYLNIFMILRAIFLYIFTHGASDVIPEHCIKDLQRQKGVGPLVSSQERRALLVSRLNR